jgi:hypothetical protein
MVTKRFREIYLTSLAAVEVLEEMVPEETKADALKEIIGIASHLITKWDRVLTLAKRQLEIVEVVERIAQSKDQKT